MYVIRFYQSMFDYIDFKEATEEMAWDTYITALELAGMTGADIELINTLTGDVLADNIVD